MYPPEDSTISSTMAELIRSEAIMRAGVDASCREARLRGDFGHERGTAAPDGVMDEIVHPIESRSKKILTVAKEASGGGAIIRLLWIASMSVKCGFAGSRSRREFGTPDAQQARRPS